MRYLRVFALSFCLFAGFTPAVAMQSTLEAPASIPGFASWSEVVDYARQNLPQEGQLIAKPDGFVYLKVDDAYIHSLFPMLGLYDEGYKVPPVFRTSESPGAHITVFYVADQVMPEEIGQTFHFELNQIAIVKTKAAYFAVLQVHSPELEKLREKYGLSPKIYGHEYHISLGQKKVIKPLNP